MAPTPLIVFLVALLWTSPASSAVFNIPSGNVTSLIAAINTANSNGEENTIILDAGVYILSAADNFADWANGLPVITSALTIRGAGVGLTSIERNPGAPPFRILFVSAAGTLVLEGLTIQNGSLPGILNAGGGSLFNEGTATVIGSSISGDSFAPGGGVRNEGTMKIIDSEVFGHSSPQGGGGGISNSGKLIISESSVSGVVVDGEGGGISNTGSLLIQNSTISGGADGGGGISNSGDLTLTNSTVARAVNFGDVGGGAGMLIGGGRVVIRNSTIADNVGDRVGPGGIWVLGGVVTLQNTILARNVGGAHDDAEAPDDCSGELTSLGNNIVGDPTGCAISLQASDRSGDPGLGTFVHSDEPGSGHIPLLPSSVAIDRGNNDVCLSDPVLATDQIGEPRVGTCDIGAIEFQSVLTVALDIRPGNAKNRVNPNSRGVLPVAILSTNGFDAGTVDPTSLRLGPNQIPPNGPARFRDVNRDRQRDLILEFRIRSTGIQCGDTSVSIIGHTVDGFPLEGSSEISTIGCKKR